MVQQASILQNSSLVKKVEDFLYTKKILVLDQSGSVRSQLTKLLADMGANRDYIFSVRSPGEAKAIVEKENISIILSEFEIDKYPCLPLFQKILDSHAEPERMMVLVTKNSQQSSVAQAMEGEVDAYIIKPFVFNYIKENIFKTILTKVSPSKEHKKLQEAQNLLQKKSYFLAEPLLVELIKSQEKPTMALYLYGNLMQARGEVDKAKAFYLKALKVQEGHFKSLNAIYEISYEEKRHELALGYLENIREMLPLSPKKLKELFTLYTFTEQPMKLFDLLNEYKDLENKPEDLISVVIASMITGGKSFIKEDRIDLAHECFYTAIGFGNFDLQLIHNICDYLIRSGQFKLAEFMLSKAKHDDRSTKEFISLDFKIHMNAAGEGYVVNRGRELMKIGAADPGVYFEYIKVHLKHDKIMPAEQALASAKKDYPELESFWLELGKCIEEGQLNSEIQVPEISFQQEPMSAAV